MLDWTEEVALSSGIEGAILNWEIWVSLLSEVFESSNMINQTYLGCFMGRKEPSIQHFSKLLIRNALF